MKKYTILWFYCIQYILQKTRDLPSINVKILRYSYNIIIMMRLFRKITSFGSLRDPEFASKTSTEDETPNPLARMLPTSHGMIYGSRASRGDHQSVDGLCPTKMPPFCLSRSTVYTGHGSIIVMIMIIICKQTPTSAAGGPSPVTTCRRAVDCCLSKYKIMRSFSAVVLLRFRE